MQTNSRHKNKRPPKCFLQNPEHFAQTAPKVFHALEAIRDHSPLGQRLYNWAKDKKIIFYEKNIRPLGLGGPYITCNINNSVATNIGIIAHELMHCVQFQSNSHSSYKYTQDVRSRIIHGQGLEAGAVACQIRILYEMKLSGHPKPWAIFMANKTMCKDKKGEWINALGAYVAVAEDFEQAFDKSIAEGKPSDIAMQDACTTAHHSYFQSRKLRNAYNKIYLKQIIVDLITCKLDYTVPRPDIEIEELRDMTQIHENEFLIHDDISIPLDDAELFGNNASMRQAFDYVEYVRLLRWGGEKNYGVMKSKNKLEDDNNPYLGLDLKEAIEILDTKGEERDIIEVMNDLVGLGNVEQLSLDFAAAANKRPPRTKLQKWKQQQKLLKP